MNIPVSSYVGKLEMVPDIKYYSWCWVAKVWMLTRTAKSMLVSAQY